MTQRQLSQRVVNTFVRGLITERGELTFPPDASVDELNCDLRREGFRRRRKALVFEDSNVLSTFTTDNDQVIWNGTWENVGGDNEAEFEVLQVGTSLFFYDKQDAPFSASQITGSAIDLTNYEHTGSEGVGNFRCQFTSINGVCVVANPGMDTIYMEYDKTTGVITASTISFKVRDFTKLSSRESLIEDLPTAQLTEEREYDTYNSGWVGDTGEAALASYILARGAHPALTHSWFSGKNSSGNFAVVEWEKIQAGSSLSTSGHFILDFFSKNRNVKGLTTLTPDTELSRFSTVATFSGRVFYAGLPNSLNAGTVLFSRQLDPFSTNVSIDTAGLGDCYQVNDPTSEDFSDLLDTDGGEIRIQEAYNIRKLHVFNNSLFVFAENGVWQITGVDDAFRANAFSTKKLTGVGLDGAQSFCSANGVPFWWSEVGIHTLGFDPNSFQPSEQNVSIETIQSFFDSIDLTARRKAIARYDPINKRIFWAYPDNSEAVITKYNNILILDLPLQAFYPWRVADQASATDSIVGMAYYTGISSQEQDLDVFSGSDDVVEGSDDIVSSESIGFTTGSPAIVFILRNGTTGSLTMGQFNGTSLLDWGDTDYSSFVESGHDFMNSMTIKKNVLKLDVKCRVTEEGFTGNDTDGYEPINPSSLLVKSFWDFQSVEANTQQAYRLKGVTMVDSTDLSAFNYPDTVVSTKLKIRGKGESVRFRFESETGKDFVLLGYGYTVASNVGL